MHIPEKYTTRAVSIYPLVTFRILFGLLMFISTLRFLLKGWVERLYIEPEFYFTYLGFHWVRPLPAEGMYAVFVLMAAASLAIALGWKYRWSVLAFFLLFNYVELLDKSNYLNHYYFVSIISFLLLFLPAGRSTSLDTLRHPARSVTRVPVWTIYLLQAQLGLVYFYAGVAKLNPAWLFEALPLRIWLPAHASLPVIGPLLTEPWVAYAFSWGGALYDLSIPFLLLIPRTRTVGFVLVVVFHLLTRLLFPIGMFPYIMICCTLIFFSPEWHERLWTRLKSLWGKATTPAAAETPSGWSLPRRAGKWVGAVLALHLMIQLLLPWRYLLYPGNLFWTEQGYRFSWRVMLMEKAGYASFTVEDPATGQSAMVDANTYLLPHQEKMMATQPDMILQFAHFLAQVYQKQGIEEPRVKVTANVTLNGQPGRLMIDPERDLADVSYNLKHRDWIIPYTPQP